MLGIGHLEVSPGDTFLPTERYPVYLSEPLVVLYLSSLFAEHNWTSKEEIVKRAFASSKSNQALRFEHEEAILLFILHIFGGKVCALSDAFHTDQPWGSRKVSLVSLKRNLEGKCLAAQFHGRWVAPIAWVSRPHPLKTFSTSSKIQMECVFCSLIAIWVPTSSFSFRMRRPRS